MIVETDGKTFETEVKVPQNDFYSFFDFALDECKKRIMEQAIIFKVNQEDLE
jgi:hypothetical protein